MVTFIKKLVRATVFEWRRKRAIKKAQRDANQLRRKFLVLIMDGKPVVVSMQGIKKLIRCHRFAKGFTAETARKIAIYEANPQPMEQRVQKTNLFGLCRVATEEDHGQPLKK